MALLMFYPYQKLNNLTDDGSYWKKIIKNCNAIFSKIHKILGKGFWNTSKYRRQGNPTKKVEHAKEQISMATINKKPDEANKN